METYKVTGRYDIPTGMWQVERSDLPGLCVAAPTAPAFVEAVNSACSAYAAGRDHRVEITQNSSLWTLSWPFAKRVIVNGTLMSRAQMEIVRTRYKAAR
ncbi:hypothetical protein [Polymorphobacter fuscus]|uniref:Uncharacterized protein n=1 Tax=Sandarakinorhabdus fusca TaxID=1439888 RepID=A0A7C9KIU7_9SPHN|nr:hypothetical protein [Polymorphobacter fuscus]KAB7645438.1 hypothetical protein F9290_11390 [Polymorphobacter fuscus]MQT17860.1 hypothetical protein [Polymorphobacter fuscus]NJC08489.1 hypothetical protein [Polymorphobacter fuscus]